PLVEGGRGGAVPQAQAFTAMISIRGLHKSYADGAGEVPVLRGLDLEAPEGEFLAVGRPSGSGKSTLLHLIARLDTNFKGDISVAGVRLSGLSDAKLSDYRNRCVGLVFQSFHLVPKLSALDNVLLPSFFRRKDAPTPGEARRRAEEALDRVGLSA